MTQENELYTLVVEQYEFVKNLERELEKAEKKYQQLQEQMLQHLAENGLTSITLTDGNKIETKRTLKCSVNVEKVEAFEACNEAKFLVKRTIHPQSLSAWVRELVDMKYQQRWKERTIDELKEVLPNAVRDAVHVYDHVSIKVTVNKS